MPTNKKHEAVDPQAGLHKAHEAAITLAGELVAGDEILGWPELDKSLARIGIKPARTAADYARELFEHLTRLRIAVDEADAALDPVRGRFERVASDRIFAEYRCPCAHDVPVYRARIRLSVAADRVFPGSGSVWPATFKGADRTKALAAIQAVGEQWGIVAKADADVHGAIDCGALTAAMKQELARALVAIPDGGKAAAPGAGEPAEERCAPMSKSEIVRRVTGKPKAKPRDLSGWLNTHDLRHVGGHKYTIRLDGLDLATRRKLEKPQ